MRASLKMWPALIVVLAVVVAIAVVRNRSQPSQVVEQTAPPPITVSQEPPSTTAPTATVPRIVKLDILRRDHREAPWDSTLESGLLTLNNDSSVQLVVQLAHVAATADAPTVTLTLGQGTHSLTLAAAEPLHKEALGNDEVRLVQRFLIPLTSDQAAWLKEGENISLTAQVTLGGVSLKEERTLWFETQD